MPQSREVELTLLWPRGPRLVPRLPDLHELRQGELLPRHGDYPECAALRRSPRDGYVKRHHRVTAIPVRSSRQFQFPTASSRLAFGKLV